MLSVTLIQYITIVPFQPSFLLLNLHSLFPPTSSFLQHLYCILLLVSLTPIDLVAVSSFITLHFTKCPTSTPLKITYRTSLTTAYPTSTCPRLIPTRLLLAKICRRKPQHLLLLLLLLPVPHNRSTAIEAGLAVFTLKRTHPTEMMGKSNFSIPTATKNLASASLTPKNG